MIFFWVGLIAGGFGSLVGIGGGLLLVPVLDHFTDLSMHVIICISLTNIIVNSLLVTAQRVRRGLVDLRLATRLEPVCLLGGVASGFLAQTLDASVLKALFALFCLFLSVFYARRFLRRHHPPESVGEVGGRAQGAEIPPKKMAAVWTFSGIVSVCSGLLGIGGGALIVPLLNVLGKVPLKIAAGTSSYVIGTTAVGALLPYLSAGHARPLWAALSGLGVVVGVSLVTLFVGRVSTRWLSGAFAVMLLAVGVRMWMN